MRANEAPGGAMTQFSDNLNGLSVIQHKQEKESNIQHKNESSITLGAAFSQNKSKKKRLKKSTGFRNMQ